MVGGGVVGERVRRNLSGILQVVPRDLAAEIVVLASPGPHAAAAAALLDRGVHVVSTSGAVDDVRELLDLDVVARANGSALVVGAAVSPGLSGLLARHLVDADHDVRRAARRRARNRRAGVRPRAPQGARRLGARLARRSVDRTGGR